MAKLSKKTFYYLLILIYCLLSTMTVGMLLTIIVELEDPKDPMVVLILIGSIIFLIFFAYWVCKKLIEESKEP